MSTPDEDFVLSFFFHDVLLSRSDFGNDLRDSVAYQIAAVNNTHCGDKEAALQLLRAAAEEIVEQSVRVAMAVSARKGGTLGPGSGEDLKAENDYLRSRWQETLAQFLVMVHGAEEDRANAVADARVADGLKAFRAAMKASEGGPKP